MDRALRIDRSALILLIVAILIANTIACLRKPPNGSATESALNPTSTPVASARVELAGEAKAKVDLKSSATTVTKNTPLPTATAIATSTPTATPTPSPTPAATSTPTIEQALSPLREQLQLSWQNGDWDSAIATLERMLNINEGDPELNEKLCSAYVNRFSIRMKANQVSAALDDFDKAVAISPGLKTMNGTCSTKQAGSPEQVQHNLSNQQKAQLRTILLNSISHYEELLVSGKRALGTTQYRDAMAGNAALLDPKSAASRFRDWRKQASVSRDRSYQEAFNQAKALFNEDGEPQGLLTWRDHMEDVPLALDDWAYDAAEWQIRTRSSAELAKGEQEVKGLLEKARQEVAALTK